MQPLPLLEHDEPHPVTVHRAQAASAVFMTCEHAGRRIPRRLGTLGLGGADLERHIAWDIGAEALALGIGERLDASLVTQTYSRLVVDCNRPHHAADLVAASSEDTTIPGNVGVNAGEVARRVAEVHKPFHDTVAACLDRRATAGRRSVLVAVHSFTPVYRGVGRPWHVGLLYNRDARVARLLAELLAEDHALVVGDNEPYRLSDTTDHTIPEHGERRGIPHVEIEVRQDLIATESGQREWAERWSDLLQRMLDRLPHE